ncbi:MAG: ferrous iron transport protein A [Oscillospiraceae bacterium]|jgi:ferrous iron transport protein A|nr:ferrous iron transport protein A [Oscillospiraceae bacterium]
MNTAHTLKELKPGMTGIVAAVGGKGALRRRIMDMGITKNTQITVEKLAPLGDPMEISVRGYRLTLRKADAKLILLKSGVGGVLK